MAGNNDKKPGKTSSNYTLKTVYSAEANDQAGGAGRNPEAFLQSQGYQVIRALGEGGFAQ